MPKRQVSYLPVSRTICITSYACRMEYLRPTPVATLIVNTVGHASLNSEEGPGTNSNILQKGYLSE